MKHWQPSLVTTDWLVEEVPLLRPVTPAELAIKGGLGIGRCSQKPQVIYLATAMIVMKVSGAAATF